MPSITLDPETYSALAALKPKDEPWGHFVRRMAAYFALEQLREAIVETGGTPT